MGKIEDASLYEMKNTQNEKIMQIKFETLVNLIIQSCRKKNTSWIYKKKLLATVHRAGNTIEEIYGVFAELVQDTKLVFPVHPRTEKYLRECGPYRKLADTPNIILIKPAAGYLEMLVLTKNAAKILTDSWWLQK